jgi:hypothetical protein
VKKKSRDRFVRLLHRHTDTDAWRQLSVGARALFIELKKKYTGRQEAVFLSARDAAELLNVNKDTVAHWYRELEHYGFIVQVRPARVAAGKGQAPHYRLTDEPYQGRKPTENFSLWEGHACVRKNRTPKAVYVRKNRTPASEKTGHLRKNGPFFRALVSEKPGHI